MSGKQDLPVLWERWAPPVFTDPAEHIAFLDWLEAEGLRGQAVMGVQVVLLDAPFLRIIRKALDEQGRPYLAAEGAIARQIEWRPLRTPPPGFAP